MENSLVVKGNKLVEARYNLNLNEQKVLLYAISKLDRDKPEMDWVELDIKEFTDLMELQGKQYDQFRATVRSLRRREVIIDTEQEELITGWLSSIRFYKNTGVVKLKFGDGLVPYLLQLKKTFTSYQLKNVLHLDSKYSIRIYELLKQYQGYKKPTKDREFDIQDLRDKLGIAPDEYNRFYDFEKRVLKTSMQEINQHTDVKMTYEKIKNGKKIARIRFTVKYPDAEANDLAEKLYNIPELKINCGLEQENWTAKQIADLYEMACTKAEDVDVYAYIKLNYIKMLEQGKARNKFAYLLKSLEEDYAGYRPIYAD
ncbi:replication initiation protein [Andreesenia angusta]|uniref:Replication initiation protein n=1 Tax=Andreesenia angusta TaxID=39480 RepID=A0A1S1V577_9FIRM|nr:replication initiation protein [Andreesenia angusta]OHW61267.1 replication initiation protein [Andreesenia angusta]